MSDLNLESAVLMTMRLGQMLKILMALNLMMAPSFEMALCLESMKVPLMAPCFEMAPYLESMKVPLMEPSLVMVRDLDLMIVKETY